MKLQARTPSVYVVLRQDEQAGDLPLDGPLLWTASPYEAAGLLRFPPKSWSRRYRCRTDCTAGSQVFVDNYYEEEAFVKRRRGQDAAGPR